jgi:hypothetical protein
MSEAGKKLDTDGSECPMGLECSIHYRNDERYLSDEYEAGRIITYWKQYMIVTDDNPAITGMTALRSMLDPTYVPPARYTTEVCEVGEGRALGDLYEESGDSDDLIREMIRFVQEHDDWNNFEDAHQMVVDLVKGNLLDLTTSYRNKSE